MRAADDDDDDDDGAGKNASTKNAKVAVTVNPDPAQYSKAAKAERKVASKAPRQDPLPPRAERPFNLFMSTEVRMP
jgi:hypothetical protein